MKTPLKSFDQNAIICGIASAGKFICEWFLPHGGNKNPTSTLHKTSLNTNSTCLYHINDIDFVNTGLKKKKIKYKEQQKLVNLFEHLMTNLNSKYDNKKCDMIKISNLICNVKLFK